MENYTYNYRQERAFVSAIAEECIGVRILSEREQTLYDGIDREIERIKIGLEIGVLA